MEINVSRVAKTDAKTLSIHMKVCDRFSARLKDHDDDTLKNYEGYVPGFMPGPHYGDYLILDIDIDTGVITNWKTPTVRQIEEFIGDGEDE